MDFAKSNNDRLPVLIAEMELEYNLTKDRAANLRFYDVTSERRYDFAYFPAPKLSSLPKDYILAAAPTTIMSMGEELRIVLHADGTIHRVLEADYRKRIVAQVPRSQNR